MEVCRRESSKFITSQIEFYQPSIDKETKGVEEDESDIINIQTIESIVYNQAIINWDSEEEDNIFERKKVFFERKNCWLNIKKRKCGTKCSNDTLKFASKRRNSRVSSVEGTNSSLVPKTCNKSKVVVSTPVGLNESIQVDGEPNKE